MLRDLKDEQMINETLFWIVSTIVLRPPLNDQSPLPDGSFDLQLLPISLAAARRQLCSGDHDDMFHDNIVGSLFASIVFVDSPHHASYY